MKFTKRQKVIAASAAGVLVVGLGGFGAWQWSQTSTSAAAYEQADGELRTVNGERNRAAAELNKAREGALAAHTAATQLSGAADPALLESPAARDDLIVATEALAKAAALQVNEVGALALPAAETANRVASTAAPEGREAQLAGAKKLEATATSLKSEAATLTKQNEAIKKAVAATEKSEQQLIASAHTKGAATEVPELASQETKDAFAAAVAALQKPAKNADLVALLRAYQDASAGMVASTEVAARNQDPASIEPTYINGILIANKTYPLPSWWGDGLTGETVAAFDAMQAEAAGQGHSLYISSGFRSYASQASIYNSLVAQVGVAGADRDTARPGHSEHQTGLTVDLNCICEGFGYQADGQWVAANAHRFGFIVRYPQGKEPVTGYIWEPWHLRYLGVENATAVYNSGLSLEEYLGITSSYN